MKSLFGAHYLSDDQIPDQQHLRSLLANLGNFAKDSSLCCYYAGAIVDQPVQMLENGTEVERYLKHTKKFVKSQCQTNICTASNLSQICLNLHEISNYNVYYVNVNMSSQLMIQKYKNHHGSENDFQSGSTR